MPSVYFGHGSEMWEYGKQARQGQREATAALAPFCCAWQERDQVKISATSALGYMLRQVDKFKPGFSTRREIYTFLVPLLLSIQDNNTEVVKVLVTSVLPTSA